MPQASRAPKIEAVDQSSIRPSSKAFAFRSFLNSHDKAFPLSTLAVTDSRQFHEAGSHCYQAVAA